MPTTDKLTVTPIDIIDKPKPSPRPSDSFLDPRTWSPVAWVGVVYLGAVFVSDLIRAYNTYKSAGVQGLGGFVGGLGGFWDVIGDIAKPVAQTASSVFNYFAAKKGVEAAKAQSEAAVNIARQQTQQMQTLIQGAITIAIILAVAFVLASMFRRRS